MANRQHSDDQDDPRTLFALLRELPVLFLELARGEFEKFKREMARKLKKLGLGAGFVGFALTLLFWFVGVLVAAGVMGFATIMPAWAAGLTMAGIILVAVIILFAIGAALVKKNVPIPTETFDSIVADAEALRGKGNIDDLD